MPISELKEFVQIANKMNFSKAAESLFLTQSSLSKKVVRLEERLGFKLFERSTRPPSAATSARWCALAETSPT